MSTCRVLLATPSRAVAARFGRGLQGLAGVDLIGSPPSGGAALEVLETALVELVVIDLEMKSPTGLSLLQQLRRRNPSVSVVVITDRDLQDHDREAIRLGVDGFLVHPIRPDHVRFMVQKVREARRLRDEYELLKGDLSGASAPGGVVGASGEMKRVYQLVSKAAASPVPVSIYGESGTGKELVAKAIHAASPRQGGPFVAVNLAAIPDTLLESELFGHVKGAYTGAGGDRSGFFEDAQGGTLFLDEVGEISPPLQVKLLRALQEKTITRVGSSRPLRVDFRLVTATNRDLLEDVRAGRFREDLFYRIHVFPIYLPPLRSRKGDLPLLAEYFLRRFTEELGTGPRGFAPGVMELLSGYSWPGNVRELENVIHRLVAMKPAGSLVELSDLSGLVGVSAVAAVVPAAGRGESSAVLPLHDHVRDYIRWAYERLGRNKARTARMLEIDRATLYRKLREAGVDGESAG